MNATGKRRLLKLADFLETAELSGEFDLTTLANETRSAQPKCGTRACALGWATTIPSFQRAGLCLRQGDLRLKGRRGNGWGETAATFFGISFGEAIDLFGAGRSAATEGMPAREAVARAIRALVASKAA